MKLTIREIRELIRHALYETAGGISSRPEPYVGNAMSPESADREQLGSLASKDKDKSKDPDDDIPSHLREPNEDPEDCVGPVPPTGQDPYAIADPYVNDYSPLPTSRTMRG